MRNDVVAAVEAPFLRNDIAVGRTPHEQSGNGTPSNAALKDCLKPFPARCFDIKFGFTKA
jgi:hypothetical protein